MTKPTLSPKERTAAFTRELGIMLRRILKLSLQEGTSLPKPVEKVPTEGNR